MLCVGPPAAGKTHFIIQLLENMDRLVDKTFNYIYWFYGQYNHTVEQLEKYSPILKTIQGIPDSLESYIHSKNEITGEIQHGLLIFDDLMLAVSQNDEIEKIAANCRHANISWVVLLQNLFHHGKARITLLRCCHYLVLFKNPLDMTVGQILARRILPGNSDIFIKIFEKATHKPNGYLFVDGQQTTPDKARLRTDIFGPYQRVFVPITLAHPKKK
jgi:hypothetical protein